MGARATRAGAWAGLVGAVVGAVVLVVILAGLREGEGAGTPIVSYFLLVLILLVCPPYPVLGAAIGALIGLLVGLLSAKRVGNIENGTAVFRLATIGGGIAGFVIGVISPIVVNGLLYLAFYLFALSVNG